MTEVTLSHRTQLGVTKDTTAFRVCDSVMSRRSLTAVRETRQMWGLPSELVGGLPGATRAHMTLRLDWGTLVNSQNSWPPSHLPTGPGARRPPTHVSVENALRSSPRTHPKKPGGSPCPHLIQVESLQDLHGPRQDPGVHPADGEAAQEERQVLVAPAGSVHRGSVTGPLAGRRA